MPQIKIDLHDELDKVVAKYRIDHDCSSKADAIIRALNDYFGMENEVESNGKNKHPVSEVRS